MNRSSGPRAPRSHPVLAEAIASAREEPRGLQWFLQFAAIASLCLCWAAQGCQRPAEKAPASGDVPLSRDARERLAASGGRDDAIRLIRMGESTTAIQILDRLQASDVAGAGGDEARLMLAGILVAQRRYADALPPLDRVVANDRVAPGYAKTLLVEAIVTGGIVERMDQAVRIATDFTASETDAESPLLLDRMSALRVSALIARGERGTAVEAGSVYLRRWPRSPRADEVRWLTAEAMRGLGRPQEASALYQSIWFDTPESPWAKEAHGRLVALGGTISRPLSVAERVQFVARLQSVGLHEEALDELARYLPSGDRDERARALRLRASSLLALRQNHECVAAAHEVRRLFPRSPQAAAAGVLAIKALRRSGGEAPVREWVRWIERSFPTSPAAVEARYDLGVLLLNLGHREEGIADLLRVTNARGRSVQSEDALWKLAWAYRTSGRDLEAAQMLRRLVAEHPLSGFRKAALYWLARFSGDRDRAAAIAYYRALLHEFPQDYYGHEAGRNLLSLGERVDRADYGNGKAFPVIDRLDTAARMPASDAYARAVSLARAGLFGFAAEELETEPKARDDLSLQFAMADLNTRAGRTWEAVAILNRHFKEFLVAGSRDPRLVPLDFWYTAYPYNYRATIESAVRDAGLASAKIEPALVAALIRMESRFLPTAVSPVGAIGLMQLMPETGARLAKEITGGTISRTELFDPETNIRYGTRYLADLVGSFRGEWFPAICSYNAGIGPVREWWQKKPMNLPMDEFIETIPYLDTRLYVKQVLGDFRNYEWIYPQGTG